MHRDRENSPPLLSEQVCQSRNRLRKTVDSSDRRSINMAQEDLKQAYTSAEECLISTQVHIIEQSSFSGKHAAAWRALN